MAENMPTMLATARSSTSYDYDSLGRAGPAGSAGPAGPAGPPAGPAAFMRVGAIAEKLKQEDNMARRVVQVFIADPNENVPLENCLLYEGEVHVTDLTDQELFFELDIKDLLIDHNIKRITFVDKKVKDRTEHLEPAKVRDLKMVVVTVASL